MLAIEENIKPMSKSGEFTTRLDKFSKMAGYSGRDEPRRSQAIAAAKTAILPLIKSGADIITIMVVANKHVNTYHTDTRMELREFISANGGSLSAPLAKMQQLSDRLSGSNAPDKTTNKVDVPNVFSRPFAELESNQCRWPVGEWGEHPSTHLCCGRLHSVTRASTVAADRLASEYCDVHTWGDDDSIGALRRGTSAKAGAPDTTPIPVRYSGTTRRGRGTPRFDSPRD